MLLVGLAVFLPGIGWGLPSRAADPLLFGDREPWTGAQIVELAGGFDAAAARGADVDANPLVDRDGVVLNATDAQRAEIVRRYRLMSRQPDEFINFSAIAGMAARGDGDPRLYQYGGVWLYGVAALLGVAKLLGLATVTGDLTVYLDDPSRFGRFYVIARLYSVAFGLLAAGAVVTLARRFSPRPTVAFAAGLTFVLLPVVIVAAHEAKPHLGGLALTLWAVVWAERFTRTRTLGALLAAGLLAGLAMGTIVNNVLTLALVVPLTFVTMPQRGVGLDDPASPATGLRPVGAWLWTSSIFLGVAGLAYAVTNPWVLINAVRAPGLLSSNLGNSTAMYRPTVPLLDALRITLQGGGRLMLLGVVAAVVLPGLALAKRKPVPAAWHLAAVTLPAVVVFVALAGGKPPEYARFGLLPITAFALASVLLMAKVGETMRKRKWHGAGVWLAVPPVLLVLPALLYVGSYLNDGNLGDRRAFYLDGHVDDLPPEAARLGGTLYLTHEPAPWSLPPVDLWQQTLILGEGKPSAAVRPNPLWPVSWSWVSVDYEPADGP